MLGCSSRNHASTGDPDQILPPGRHQATPADTHRKATKQSTAAGGSASRRPGRRSSARGASGTAAASGVDNVHLYTQRSSEGLDPSTRPDHSFAGRLRRRHQQPRACNLFRAGVALAVSVLQRVVTHRSEAKEGNLCAALCPELDVASQGTSVEEATSNLREAVELSLECADPEELKRRLRTEVFVTRIEAEHG
jgi:predicted RNase H-like HicB family nuclease